MYASAKGQRAEEAWIDKYNSEDHTEVVQEKLVALSNKSVLVDKASGEISGDSAFGFGSLSGHYHKISVTTKSMSSIQKMRKV